MQSYSFSVSLRIWHPNIAPSTITLTLGLNPDFVSTAGEARRTPKGRLLSGTYAESYWCSRAFNDGEQSSLDEAAEDVLVSALDILSPHKAFLRLLREQGARLNLEVSSFGGRNYALELSPLLLTKCAELGLSIVHDVYAVAQNKY
jgi:hypothetical protein